MLHLRHAWWGQQFRLLRRGRNASRDFCLVRLCGFKPGRSGDAMHPFRALDRTPTPATRLDPRQNLPHFVSPRHARSGAPNRLLPGFSAWPRSTSPCKSASWALCALRDAIGIPNQKELQFIGYLAFRPHPEDEVLPPVYSAQNPGENNQVGYLGVVMGLPRYVCCIY